RGDAHSARPLRPGGQAGRGAPHRTPWMNNLKQLGLALHNYPGVNRIFPNGDDWNTTGTPPPPTPGTRGTYYAALLRFAEQDNQVATWRTSAQHVPLFVCPSRRGSEAGARDDYAAARHFGNFSGSSWRTIMGGQLQSSPTNDYNFPGAGIANVTDGTSNTLMLAHKALRSDKYAGCTGTSSSCADQGWSWLTCTNENKRSPIQPLHTDND